MCQGVWGRAKPHLESALKRSGGKDTLADVQHELLNGNAQLWTAPGTAVVTIRDGLDLCVWLYGGSREPMADLLASAEGFARSVGLQRVTVNQGRLGWVRLLRPLGFMPGDDVQLFKEVDHGRKK